MNVQDSVMRPPEAPLAVTSALFAGLDEGTTTLLSAYLSEEHFPAAALIFEDNAPGDTLYIVKHGEVKVSKLLAQNQEQILRVMGPGEFFGEMALLEDQPRSARVSTLTPTTLLAVTRQRFSSLIERHPSVAIHFLKAISAQLRFRYQDQERLLREKQGLVDELAAKNSALEQALEELKAAMATVAEHQRVQRDLEIAREIQQHMLPLTFPHSAQVRMHAVTEPATWVGGDFYDALWLDGRRLGLLLGDVSGKGIPAAMHMARLMGEFRACVSHCASPANVMQTLNGLLCQRNVHVSSFVTVQYLLLDLDQRRVQFLCAGHPPILLRHADGGVDCLGQQPNIPLGIDDSFRYHQEERELVAGDTLLCYSDGIYERHDVQGTLLGLPRLTALFAAAPAEPREIIATIRQAVDLFGAREALHDDTTLLCVQIL